MSGFHLFVTTGLDPVVHAALTIRMACRIKSGNDDGRDPSSRGASKRSLRASKDEAGAPEQHPSRAAIARRRRA